MAEATGALWHNNKETWQCRSDGTGFLVTPDLSGVAMGQSTQHTSLASQNQLCSLRLMPTPALGPNLLRRHMWVTMHAEGNACIAARDPQRLQLAWAHQHDSRSELCPRFPTHLNMIHIRPMWVPAICGQGEGVGPPLDQQAV